MSISTTYIDYSSHEDHFGSAELERRLYGELPYFALGIGHGTFGAQLRVLLTPEQLSTIFHTIEKNADFQAYEKARGAAGEPESAISAREAVR